MITTILQALVFIGAGGIVGTLGLMGMIIFLLGVEVVEAGVKRIFSGWLSTGAHKFWRSADFVLKYVFVWSALLIALLLIGIAVLDVLFHGG